MNRARKLVIVPISAVLLASILVVFKPVEAHPRPGSVPPPCDSAACDPYCTHWCPNAKKQGSEPCIFLGCNPTNGECMYSNPCGPN
jgi:hypothetical protein